MLQWVGASIALSLILTSPIAHADPANSVTTSPDMTVGNGPSVDPLLPIGVALMPVALLGVGIGGYLLTPESTTMCDVTGPCVETSFPIGAEQRAHGVGFVSAGLAAGVVGLTAIGVGAWRTRCRVGRTGPHLMLGTWLIGVGLASAAMGVGALVAFDRDPQGSELDTHGGAVALAVHGLLMTSVGAGFAGYGLAAEEPDTRSYVPTSQAQVYVGMGLATAASTSAGATAMLLANDVAEGPHRYAAILYVLPIAASLGLAGAGLTLWIRGGRAEQPSAVTLGAGPAGLAIRTNLP
jgi:hypothetical protein